MPFLDASALEADPEGAAFLLAVLRWRYNPRQGIVGGQLSPLLGLHSIWLNRGLTPNGRARKFIARESAGYRLSRQSPFYLFQPSTYHVTIKTGTRA